MAHEYGHFLTNRFESEVTVLNSYSRIPASERFADAFARCMLMPSTGLRRKFNSISRQAAGRITASEVCRLAHDYSVSVEAMMLRLEGLRLLPSGTWERLRDRGFKVREAQAELGLVPHTSSEELLPLRYRMLAVSAYEEGELTEGEPGAADKGRSGPGTKNRSVLYQCDVLARRRWSHVTSYRTGQHRR